MGALFGLLLLLVSTPAAAFSGRVIDLGSIDLTGTFTLLQLDDTPQPIGVFSTPLTVADVDGMFEPFVALGDTTSPGPLVAPADWALGDLTLHTDQIFSAGPSWGSTIYSYGFEITGLPDIAGHWWAFWEFDAPPWRGVPVSQEITFHIQAYRERVPEPATLWLVLPALGLVAWRPMRRWIGLLLLAALPTYAGAASNILTWTDNADNETTQNIERGTAPTVLQCPTAAFLVLASVAANVTTYTDSGVVAGTVYCYRLNAQNAVGVSLYSPIVGRLVPPTVPAAPSGLGVTGGP